MKSLILLVAIFAGVNGQSKGAKCEYLKDIKSQPDPLIGYPPGKATFPCDMMSPIKFGPVPKGCAKLEVICARGTSEPGDFGTIVGDPVVARVKRDLPGVEARGYPVQYPAGTTGSGTGVADIQKRIAQQMTACPDEKFALVGYSQGGMITVSAAGKLTAAQREKVVAVVLYGGGDGSGVAAAMRNKTLANCAPGDFACPKSGSGEGHVSYNNIGSDWHDRSSKYIVSAFEGKPLGQKLMRTIKGPL